MAFGRMYMVGDDRVYIRKYFTDVADVSEADDLFELSTPSGQKIVIDEAGSDTALWTAAGVEFKTADSGEFFSLTLEDLVAGFPDNTNNSLFASINSSTKVAGSSITFGEGAYGFDYNNSEFRVQLNVNTILEAISTAAKDVLDCQCDCEINSAKAQHYIKMRAQFDLILEKANSATNFSAMAEINEMITVLMNYVAGTDNLCGSC